MNKLNNNILHKTLIDHMNEGVWVGDKNERTLYANPKFCKMVGYKLKEILGRESYDFWDKESVEKVRNVNNKERKKGKSSSYEGILLSKTGEKIPVLCSGAPLPEGGTIGIMTDLRDFKKHESVYQKLVEHMNEAIWIGDKNERTIYANPKFCTMMEYSLQEMLGKESYIFWDKETANKVRNVNHTERKKGISSSYEGNLQTRTDKKIPVLLSGTPLLDGGTIGIMTDLTELKKKDEKEKILNQAIRHSTDAIITFDTNGKIESWNNGAKIIFGYKEAEILGKKLNKIFPPSDIESVLNNKEVVYNLKLNAKHKNKTDLKIAAAITPIKSEKNKDIIFHLIIARDIASQIRFEEELEAKYRKIRDAYNQFGIIRRQMDYIFELLDSYKESTTPKTIADFIVTSIIMLTKVDACVLRVYNSKNDTLDLLSSFGLARDWQGKSNIKYIGSLAEKAFIQKTSLKIIDLTKESKYQSKYLARKNNLSSLLLIPLVFKSKIAGSLSLYAGPNKKLEIFENEFIEKYAKLVEIIVATL